MKATKKRRRLKICSASPLISSFFGNRESFYFSKFSTLFVPLREVVLLQEKLSAYNTFVVRKMFCCRCLLVNSLTRSVKPCIVECLLWCYLDEGFYFHCCLVFFFLMLFIKVIYIFELWIYISILAINPSYISYLTVPYCGCVSSSSLESQVCDMQLAYFFVLMFCWGSKRSRRRRTGWWRSYELHVSRWWGNEREPLLL